MQCEPKISQVYKTLGVPRHMPSPSSARWFTWLQAALSGGRCNRCQLRFIVLRTLCDCITAARKRLAEPGRGALPAIKESRR